MNGQVEEIRHIAENRENFLRCISEYAEQNSIRFHILTRADTDAGRALAGQTRARGEPKIEHARRVALKMLFLAGVKDLKVLCAAVLHDVIEDGGSEWNEEWAREGYGLYIAQMVCDLSKPSKDDFGGSRVLRDAYHHAAFEKQPRQFFTVRIADRTDNMETLGSMPIGAQMRIIEVSKRVHVPYAHKYGILVPELTLAIAQAEERIAK